MNKKIMGFILTVLFSFNAPTSSAGIPVIDGAVLTQQITQVMNMVRQLQQLQAQLETAGNQLARAEEQVRSANGIRGLGSLINTAYDSSVSISQSGILTAAGLKSSSDLNIALGRASEIFDGFNEISAIGLGQSKKTLEQSISRFNDLLPLIQKVNNSPDEKDILDLQARISGEAVFLQNEQIKLAAMKAESEAQERMQKQKIRQALIESSGNPTPIAWWDQ